MKQIKEVEARVEFPLQKATVTGRIDVLLHDGNCIEIRDYKTSKDSTNHDDSSIQVQMYALGMSMTGEEPLQASTGPLALCPSGPLHPGRLALMSASLLG